MAAAQEAVSIKPHEKSYLIGLLIFVCFVTLFEGYDLLIINLALPYLGTDFGADSRTLGNAVGLINVGTILAFIPVRLADRFGRRRVFLTAISGYTLFTLLSAFSVGLYDFVAYQFIARMFMVTEIGVGAIILTEEMPARYRGVAVTLMFALSLGGGIVGSVVFPVFGRYGTRLANALHHRRDARTRIGILLATLARNAALYRGRRARGRHPVARQLQGLDQRVPSTLSAPCNCRRDDLVHRQCVELEFVCFSFHIM